jgi:hypothetical protein
MQLIDNQYSLIRLAGGFVSSTEGFIRWLVDSV